MKLNLISRMAALLSIAFFMAISFTATGQKSVPLANARFNQLLTTGDAANLRARILARPGAKLGRKGIAETQTGTVGNKAVTVEIASQFFNTNDGEVEQVAIRLNDGGTERFWLLSAIGDRIVERLDNDAVETTLGDAVNCLREQLGDSEKCNKCLDNLTGCLGLSIGQAVACLTGRLLNPLGPCVRCGAIAVVEAIDCAVGGN